MKTIETRIIPATNHKPRRIVATDSDKRFRLMYSIHEIENNLPDDSRKEFEDCCKWLCARFIFMHMPYARALPLYGGHSSNDSMIWVFADEYTKVDFSEKVKP